MIEDIIKAWAKDCSLYYKKPIYYYIKKHWFRRNELIIMTSYPGVLIGLHGDMYHKYEKIFKLHGYNYHIKIIELPIYNSIKELKF